MQKWLMMRRRIAQMEQFFEHEFTLSQRAYAYACLLSYTTGEIVSDMKILDGSIAQYGTHTGLRAARNKIKEV